ncbi:hypothetical protein SAMN02746089_02507 [Caldanaerobius fijiensis DSM 17918]|uniref:Uncharacterized protein n=1 Tax=Caldanaerobius fijiensis DSM 17918 TaxID=1121256 RepID=A0A1M5EAE4_9THEO|nr:hypothetical protein [Caldanaerobius fijiensis]SHF76165.1 hypothetical protein SAMN02746089_02507 [Caldanaerobius fijiensis DSM 17918]
MSNLIAVFLIFCTTAVSIVAILALSGYRKVKFEAKIEADKVKAEVNIEAEEDIKK